MQFKTGILAAGFFIASLAVGQAAENPGANAGRESATAPGPMGTVTPDPDVGCKTASSANQMGQTGQSHQAGVSDTTGSAKAAAKKAPPCP